MGPMPLIDHEARERETSTLEIPFLTPNDWMVEVQDEDGARCYPLTDSPLVFGTSLQCDVRLFDPTVSQRHCSLEVGPGGVRVADLHSRNGTFVGNARIREAWAGEGAAVSIGRSSLVCRPQLELLHEGGVADPLPGLVGGSVVMRRLSALVRRLARLSAPVLVSGETGTGKELVAHALHALGPRVEHPFVPINVAALPRELVESELFGHERGAFTGAVRKRLGAFAEAAYGTIFLDEIGELPLDAQPKLLRALDGYDVRRVGGSAGALHARLVAATHVALFDCVEQGTFRRDLFHRLEVFAVRVPPLRERRGDIAALARHFLKRMEPEYGRVALAPSALARLVAYDWPGNVRELRNVLYRALDHAAPTRVLHAAAVEAGLARPSEVRTDLTPALARSLVLRHEGNLSAAARAANVPRTTFRKILAARAP